MGGKFCMHDFDAIKKMQELQNSYQGSVSHSRDNMQEEEEER